MRKEHENKILEDWKKNKSVKFNQKIENPKIRFCLESEHNLGITYNYSIEYDLVENNIIKYFKTDTNLTSSFKNELIMGY